MKEYIVKADHLIDGYGMQAVGELIRCKDCKHHWDDDRCEMMPNMIETDDGWWCADGERKDHD